MVFYPFRILGYSLEFGFEFGFIIHIMEWIIKNVNDYQSTFFGTSITYNIFIASLFILYIRVIYISWYFCLWNCFIWYSNCYVKCSYQKRNFILLSVWICHLSRIESTVRFNKFKKFFCIDCNKWFPFFLDDNKEF